MLHNKAWSLLAMIWADRLGVCLGILWLIWYAAADEAHRGIGAGGILFVFGPWLLARFLHFIMTGRLAAQRQSRPWRPDQRVNLRVGLLVAALAALAYWSSSTLVSGVSLFAMLVFGYWLISSAGHSSELSRGEVMGPERPAGSPSSEAPTGPFGRSARS